MWSISCASVKRTRSVGMAEFTRNIGGMPGIHLAKRIDLIGSEIAPHDDPARVLNRPGEMFGSAVGESPTCSDHARNTLDVTVVVLDIEAVESVRGFNLGRHAESPLCWNYYTPARRRDF